MFVFPLIPNISGVDAQGLGCPKSLGNVARIKYFKQKLREQNAKVIELEKEIVERKQGILEVSSLLQECRTDLKTTEDSVCDTPSPRSSGITIGRPPVTTVDTENPIITIDIDENEDKSEIVLKLREIMQFLEIIDGAYGGATGEVGVDKCTNLSINTGRLQEKMDSALELLEGP